MRPSSRASTASRDRRNPGGHQQDRRWRTDPGGRLDRRSPARGMSGLSCVAALSAAGDAGRFGGKAAQLAAARRAGLPVPDGWALGWDEVEALVLDETRAS